MITLLTIQYIFLLFYFIILIEHFWSGKVPQIYFFYAAIIELCIIIPIFILNVIDKNIFLSLMWFICVLVWSHNLYIQNKLRKKCT